MGYRRKVLTRWSSRDRLAILGIALVVALPIGSVVLLSTAGAQTTRIAADSGTNVTVERYEAPALARTKSSVVFPVASATIDGTTVTLVGVRDNASSIESIPTPERPASGTAFGPDTLVGNYTLDSGARLDVQSGRDRGIFPDSWLVVRAELIDRLGADVAYGLSRPETPTGQIPRQGVPVVSALAFFIGGTNDLLAALWPLATGAAVLCLVVVFGVTRTSVRDDRETIHVLRATGAPPRTILGLYVARAGLQTAIGVGLGYGIGVVVTNAITNLATFLGLPTTLNPRVTIEVAWRLLPVVVGLVVVGAVAGALAAWPVARGPPVSLLGRYGGGAERTRLLPATVGLPSLSGPNGRLGRVREAVSPTMIDARAALPTTATLSVLVAVVLFVTAAGGTVAPLVGGSAGTVAEPDAAHVVASRVDAGYASAIQSQGIDASPEVLAFATVDGQPLLVRGANFSSFAAVSDADVLAGAPPTETSEAVVGEDLATAYGLSVGDALLLGGSTAPAMAEVRVVGTFDAPGYVDDQLVVSLPVGRHLGDVRAGMVNVIRIDRRAFEATTTGRSGEPEPVVVTDLQAPKAVAPGEPFTATVRVRNLGSERHTRTLTVAFARSREQVTVSVPPSRSREVSIEFEGQDTGRYELSTAGMRREVVVSQDAAQASLQLSGIPRRAPPNETLTVRVHAGGAAIENATVSIDGQVVATDESGRAEVTLPGPGSYTLDVTAEGRRTERPIQIARGTRRHLTASVHVRPETPSPLSEPTAIVTVANPWRDPLTRTISVDAPGPRQSTGIELGPGQRRQLRFEIGRAPTGTHEVTVDSGGESLARAQYAVRGDDRIVSAIASTGRYSPQSGLENGITSAFGNLELVLGALVVLTALATGGTIGAGFAASVSACRRSIAIRRATGATPLQVLGIVLADAARIATMAVLPALVAGYLAVRTVAAMGLFTFFGVSIVPAPSIPVLVAIGVVGVLVACCGATTVAIPLVRAPPAELLDNRGSTRDRPETEPPVAGGSHE